MPDNEALEMLYKYSRFFEVPVSEETAYAIIKITEGSPFYISSILRSRYNPYIIYGSLANNIILSVTQSQ